MSTISVPIPSQMEEAIGNLIKRGYGANKADVLRKALARLVEEEAVFSVLQAEQEVKEGKIARGDLKKILKKI